MTEKPNLLKVARTWHRKVASLLFAFFFIIAVTGVLLGWKNSFATKVYELKAKSNSKTAAMPWLPLDSLKRMAVIAFSNHVHDEPHLKLESMTARLDKGSIRFSFGNVYQVQLNAVNGQLITIDKKAPEWFIKLHDGELIDDLFKTKGGISKKVYASVMGASLFFLTLSGFWMWFKPRQMKMTNKS